MNTGSVNPNIANPHLQESLRSRHGTPSAAALGREQFGFELTAERLGPIGARLGQDFTYGRG